MAPGNTSKKRWLSVVHFLPINIDSMLSFGRIRLRRTALDCVVDPWRNEYAFRVHLSTTTRICGWGSNRAPNVKARRVELKRELMVLPCI